MGIPVFPSLWTARRMSRARELRGIYNAPILSIDVKATLVKHFEEQILIIGPRCGKKPLIWSGYDEAFEEQGRS